MPNPPVVAVFNTSPDTVDLLRRVIEQAGYLVVTAFTHDLRDGRTDLEVLMREHQPQVIVYDIAIPYEENWRLFQHIRDSPACTGVRFVLTTTNVTHVQKIAGREHRFHEIVGKPYDLDQVVRGVKEAVHARPTR